jgi:hypothetical protein
VVAERTAFLSEPFVGHGEGVPSLVRWAIVSRSRWAIPAMSQDRMPPSKLMGLVARCHAFSQQSYAENLSLLVTRKTNEINGRMQVHCLCRKQLIAA